MAIEPNMIPFIALEIHRKNSFSWPEFSNDLTKTPQMPPLKNTLVKISEQPFNGCSKKTATALFSGPRKNHQNAKSQGKHENSFPSGNPVT